MSAVALNNVSRTNQMYGGHDIAPPRGARSDDGTSNHRTGYFQRYPARAVTPNPSVDGERKVTASLNGHGNGPSRRIRSNTSTNASESNLPTELDSQKVVWPSKPLNSSPTASGRSSPELSYVPPTKSPATPISSSKSKGRSSATGTVPELRHSASTLDRSSFSPPHTPVNHNAPFSMDHVVVAGGVEMMDALVDGMNGVFGENSSSGENDFRSTARAKRNAPRKTHSSSEKPKKASSPRRPSTPPLPAPPNGVKLGLPKMVREVEIPLIDDEDDDGELPLRPPRATRPRTRSSTNPSTHKSASQTIADNHLRRGRSSTQLRTPKAPPEPLMTTNPTIDQIIKDMVLRGDEKVIPKSSRPSMAPSISDIIRSHGPELSRHRFGRTPTTPLPASPEEPEHDDDATSSRSSIDSITHEVQSSLRKTTPQPLHHARSFPNRPIGMGSTPPATFDSRRSMRISESEHEYYREPSKYAPSVYSASSYGVEVAPSLTSLFYSPPAPDSAMGVAQYLKSPRLTKLMTLRKPPHRGLTVSLADVGNPNGRPILVFLGLGCVRYIVALYDEMAEALGLRLIAIDRWGMGRTAEVPQDQRGLKEWAAVCEEVLDTLHVKDVGILAHSAGAPYALAFALRAGRRVNGSIHLLAPWVGGNGENVAGYKWLKYVPNSFIKAAQNAEWKVHGWKLGKPPTIVYEGIGFDPKAPVSGRATPSQSPGLLPLTADALADFELEPSPSKCKPKREIGGLSVPRPSSASGGRPSIGAWSDYDDLADFEGRFGSTTTLGTVPPVPPLPKGVKAAPIPKRKNSKGFFNILKNPQTSGTKTPTNNRPVEKDSTTKPAHKLKGLKSISSLKGKFSGSKTSPGSEKTTVYRLDTNIASMGSGLGIDVASKNSSGGEEGKGIEEWGRNVASQTGSFLTAPKLDPFESQPSTPWSSESHAIVHPPQRSVSLTVTGASSSEKSAKTAPTVIHRPSSSPATPARPLSGHSSTFSVVSYPGPRPGATTTAPTSSIATALLRASHKEAQKGTANDLLSILERDSKPWGFKYSDVPHKVKIWYGDRDEKIGESGIRWMEKTMQECEVKICKGKDHSLMTSADVVVEALESLQEELRDFF